MKYRYTLPQMSALLAAADASDPDVERLCRLARSMSALLAAADASDPDVERLCRLARSKGMFQALCDWGDRAPERGTLATGIERCFRQDADIMEIAKVACIKLLLEEETEEGTAITNSAEAFTWLFLQTYYGAYVGIVESAKRSLAEMVALEQLVRSLPEADAIAALDEVAEWARKETS
jgi:hypothetical protein